MYVRMYEISGSAIVSGSAKLIGAGEEIAACRRVFDGWFPEEAGIKEIAEILSDQSPGVDEGAAGGQCFIETRTQEASGTAEYWTIDGEKLTEPPESLTRGIDRCCATQPPTGYKMVVLLPKKLSYIAKIRDELAELQKCVSGYIEITYPFDDNCLVIGNDEAKLIGMMGNRRINGEIYAGPLLIAGDDFKGGFCDLTQKQAEKYVERFLLPENISDEEVDGSIRIEIYVV